MSVRNICVIIWGALALPACASEEPRDCNNIKYDNASYTVCAFDMSKVDIKLYLNDETGTPYGNFTKLDGVIEEKGDKLDFAMNGGMYHQDRSPAGLFIEDGTEIQKINTNEGPGNFHLLPNGVLLINETGVVVEQTAQYALTNRPKAKYATQSGPMLVINGKLHPAFKKGSDSLNIRNGVGVAGDTVFFAISNEKVNFHSFASLFKDHLGTPNALFLDGAVSKMYAPELDRNDYGAPMGPIIAVTNKPLTTLFPDYVLPLTLALSHKERGRCGMLVINIFYKCTAQTLLKCSIKFPLPVGEG